MKFIDFTGDDDYACSGAIFEGLHTPTVGKLKTALRRIANEWGVTPSEVVQEWRDAGSVHLCVIGDDPTGEYAYLLSGETFTSGETHYCDEDCPEDCEMDGEDREPTNQRPCTVFWIDCRRAEHLADQRAHAERVARLEASRAQ